MRTYAGRDWMCAIMGDPASNGTGTYAPATWMALSTDSSAALASRTTLPGEQGGGTLARGQATYSHTSGTASYTLIKTWVADRDLTVYKYGFFTALSGGVLAWEKELADGAQILKSGDSIQIVHTVSL